MKTKNKKLIAKIAIALSLTLFELWIIFGKNYWLYLNQPTMIIVYFLFFFLLTLLVWFIIDKANNQNIVLRVLLLALILTIIATFFLGRSYGGGFEACNLTGIPFSYHSSCTDDLLNTSSSTHYSAILYNFMVYLIASSLLFSVINIFKKKKLNREV
ncbi:MAG: hypothetical protein ABH826_02985 [Patescibacteria group bacterium]